jgi:flagellar protein FliO/FliZ
MNRRVLALASACGWLLHAPTFALAAATGERTPLRLPADAPQQLNTGGGGSGLVRTIVGLAVVIGVIYGVAWILKQVKASREERTVGFGLESAATIPLGPNRALHLVRAGRELVLVGVAEQGVVPIRTYTEEEAIAVGLIGNEPVEPPPPSTPGGPPLVALQERLRETVQGIRARTVRG